MKKQILNQRPSALLRWICVWAVICVQVSQFTFTAYAQEPTTEPTPLPTPTPAPTWTPTPMPTNTPDPAATPTVDPTAAARVVDFRVDEEEIVEGDCVTFSWVVRGDIDRIEFDQRGDNKMPVLVPDMDSRQECPTEDTTYDLIVTWMDATQTERTIEVKVNESNSGGSSGGGSGSGAATPAGTAVFVNVTPIPVIIGTPVSNGGGTGQPGPSQDASGRVVVTPVGVLASVQVLPETGYLSPPTADSPQAGNDFAPVEPNQGFWPEMAGSLAVFLAIAAIGLILASKIIGNNEASR